MALAGQATNRMMTIIRMLRILRISVKFFAESCGVITRMPSTDSFGRFMFIWFFLRYGVPSTQRRSLTESDNFNKRQSLLELTYEKTVYSKTFLAHLREIFNINILCCTMAYNAGVTYGLSSF